MIWPIALAVLLALYVAVGLLIASIVFGMGGFPIRPRVLAFIVLAWPLLWRPGL